MPSGKEFLIKFALNYRPIRPLSTTATDAATERWRGRLTAEELNVGHCLILAD